MPSSLARDRNGVGTIGAFVALLIALAIIVAAYYILVVPPAVPPVVRVQHGDAATVDYIGYFQDTGLVFDTSFESVAQDNATWPKAVSFPSMPAGSAWRARWQPIRFDIGQGANRAIPGFEQGLIGLAAGEGRAIIVPMDVGYGPMDPSLIQVRPRLEAVPVRITMNSSSFQATYGATPVSGMNVSDPFWRWAAYVSVAGSLITVTNSPSVGDVVRPYGQWEARVVAIDDAANGGDGVVWVRHLLEPSMANRVGGFRAGQPFYVSDIDLEADTYTMNFNREVVGRTLVFVVTIVSVFRT